ncbi:MAG: rRNA pseudouridine synthase [Alphaproteobacteria bacterium]|nr:rRNA pseudouridine synthase [Alphaproteobacteria bacterium]
MTVRIGKYIADSGIASRRHAEELIRTGHVSVNGTVIDTPVHFVSESDVVCVDGRVVSPQPDTVVYAFHKPINTMTTTRDTHGRKTIYDCLPQHLRGLKYIGRLDYKTTGLLLLTNNGDLARKMTLPSSGIIRTYVATVNGNDYSGLDAARSGITVDGVHYAPMEIIKIGGNQLLVRVTEGKKNEIRIVLRSVGCPVRKLHRVSYGKIKLGNLPVGKIQQIPQKTIDELLKTF